MRKELLLPVALLATWGVAAQAPVRDGSLQKWSPEDVIDAPSTVPYATAGSKVFTGVALGNSANAYGVGFGPSAYTWADPTANAILFTHRADPAVTPAAVNSGGIVIDFSTDGGTTWSVNQGPMHIPDGTTRFNARYPRGVIFNPTGNTVGSNAYASLSGPTLSGTSGSWGGTFFSTGKLDPSNMGVVSDEVQSGTWDPSFAVAIGDDYTFVPATQKTFGIFERSDGSAVSIYNDTLFLSTGTWDATNMKVAHTWSKVYFPVGTDTSDGTKVMGAQSIAASPNGNTVWISATCYNQTTVECFSPSFVKSTDGGTTWSPIINVNVNTLTSPELGGTVLNYMATNYPGWDINDLTCHFRPSDLVVDKNGNPHLAATLMPATATTTFAPGGATAQTPFAIFNNSINLIVDITSTDGGTTWKAHFIDSALTHRGDFGLVVDYNRVQASRDLSGDIVTISYFSTDPALYGSDNIYPDMHLGGVSVDGDSVLMKYNMTAGTTYEATANQGCVSHFIFDNGDGTYTVPTVIQNFAGGDPLADVSPTTFSYWPVVYAPTDTSSGFGLEEAANFGVSQSYPNPATTKAYVDINANDASNFSIRVVNMLGQVVYAKDLGRLQAGSTRIEIPTAQFGSGMYLYTITDGQGSVTNRMVVR